MPRKTQGVYDLVNEVLKTKRAPYSEDIIEDVCLVIEEPNRKKIYDDLVLELSLDVVNNFIGKYTRQITGLNVFRHVKAKRATIIGFYTKLRL